MLVPMPDLAYIALTVVSFALLAAAVKGVARG